MTDVFRTAVTADADELAQLIHSAYRGESSRGGWTTEADLLQGQRINADQVLEVVNAPQAQLLLLTDDQGISACCQLEDRGDGLAYFGMFAVRPGQQGGGIGRRVMTEAMARVRDQYGATVMELTVIGQRTELIEWYERLGFVRTGETRPFPYGQRVFGDPQREDLHFVVLRRALAD